MTKCEQIAELKRMVLDDQIIHSIIEILEETATAKAADIDPTGLFVGRDFKNLYDCIPYDYQRRDYFFFWEEEIRNAVEAVTRSIDNTALLEKEQQHLLDLLRNIVFWRA